MIARVLALLLAATPAAAQTPSGDPRELPCVAMMLEWSDRDWLLPEARTYLRGFEDGLLVLMEVLGRYAVNDSFRPDRYDEICAIDPTMSVSDAAGLLFAELMASAPD